MVPLAQSPCCGSPRYNAKDSQSVGFSSLEDISKRAESSLEHGKRPNSMGNRPSRVDFLDQAVPALQDHLVQGGKRKTTHSPEGVECTGYAQGNLKKVKLGAEEEQPFHLTRDKAQLPPEIWHHIFTFIPTRRLGVLLRVNRLFNEYLDPQFSSRSHSSPSEYSRCIKPLLPDTIWQLSRRLHWPKMPAPLRNRSELDMWRLCCTKVCNLCGAAKSIQQQRESYNSWRLGPGLDGLAPIFAFGITCCGPCLLKSSVKVRFGSRLLPTMSPD